MVLIDAHTHLPSKPSRIVFVRKKLDEMIHEMDKNGIDITITMTRITSSG